MATTHQAAPTAATDYDDYQTVVDIVNNGFKDAIAEILRKLGDPNHFADHVRYLADRQGVSLEAVNDTRGLFDAFWRTNTGVHVGMTYMNAVGVPERCRSYVEQITPQPAPSAIGPVTNWGFSLPFGIEFHT